MKKSILILALCFVMLFAVAAVSAQETEVPAEEPVTEEVVEEAVEEAVEETVEEAVEEAVEETVEEAVEETVEEEAAEEKADGFTVKYLENDCLAEVPTDENAYAAGDEVTVLFEPVAYKDYLIFYGWDIDDDGVADFGYNYDKFEMPEEDVELKAICIGAAGGGSTCKDCHLHGTPNNGGISTFVPTWPSTQSSAGN